MTCGDQSRGRAALRRTPRSRCRSRSASALWRMRESNRENTKCEPCPECRNGKLTSPDANPQACRSRARVTGRVVLSQLRTRNSEHDVASPVR
eukprot:5961976-Prymnesium_polylepis.2